MAWGRPSGDRGEARLERSVLAGIAAFRWAALVWLITVQIASRSKLAHPWAVIVAVGVVVVATVVLSVLFRVIGRRLLSPVVVGSELVLGFVLLAADGWVYDRAHSQSLGAAWPMAGVLTAGVAWGWTGGAAAGVVLGLGRVLATHTGDGSPASTLSLISTCVLYGQVGAVAGFVVRRLRIAEFEISAARAREEVARTLHDGVLQTLAVVQRRSTDADLASLARDQERELRQFLFGMGTVGDDLVTTLRGVAARFERHHGGRAEVTVVEEPAGLSKAAVDAIAGAVGEALTNAGKHGGADHVVVYVEPDDDTLFVSVKDGGCGFDVAETVEGVGLSRSIRGRLADVGGRVEISSVPGSGTEVRLWAPLR